MSRRIKENMSITRSSIFHVSMILRLFPHQTQLPIIPRKASRKLTLPTPTFHRAGVIFWERGLLSSSRLVGHGHNAGDCHRRSQEPCAQASSGPNEWRAERSLSFRILYRAVRSRAPELDARTRHVSPTPSVSRPMLSASHAPSAAIGAYLLLLSRREDHKKLCY